MTPEIQKKMQEHIRSFRLPHYEEITDVGLYLDQTARYINSFLSVLGENTEITTSMISNYVKKKLLANPQRKLYSREQIAMLFFIALTKPMMSLEHVHTVAQVFAEAAGDTGFYELFRSELLKALWETFGLEDGGPASQQHHSDQVLIHSVIRAIADTTYMNLCFRFLASKDEA